MIIVRQLHKLAARKPACFKKIFLASQARACYKLATYQNDSVQSFSTKNYVCQDRPAKHFPWL
jgi:hypothetical protein